MSYLQDVSSETEETSKASGGADDGAVGAASERRLGWLRGLGADWDSWDRGNWGGLSGVGGVDVGWGRWLSAVKGGDMLAVWSLGVSDLGG